MIKVGLFGIGLETYWGQFEGLLDRLISYQNEIKQRIETDNCAVVDGGMVDSYGKAQKVVDHFLDERVDCLVLFISTYALSQNALPIAQKIKAPLFLLNLQPVKAIDYKAFNELNDRGKMTGEWLAHCQSCVAPELASVFNRSGIDYSLISGYLKEEAVWKEVGDYMQAVRVIKQLSNTRTGLMGHYYNGMLDVYSDITQQSAVFGNHFEIVEFGVLKSFREQVSNAQIEEKLEEFNKIFDVSPDCSESELNRAAKTAVALDRLVSEYDLGALAYYYEGVGDRSYQDIVTSLIPGFTLLTGKHIPVAGEYEIKNVQAMKIMDLLKSGGSFSEFYAIDFNTDEILLGHDGPAHFAIADGQVGLVPLPVYHGKPGKGLSIQMTVKDGPVTLLSVAQNRAGELYFVCAEGEAVPGLSLQIGNTNSRYRFSLSAKEFINKWSLAGPSHHCAIGVGHKASVLQKMAGLLNIECITIC